MNNVNLLLGKFSYVRRYLRDIIPYVTLQKIMNLFRNELEFKLNITNVKSLPSFIKIEPTDFCQLNCPGCISSKSKNNSLSLEILKTIIEPLKKALLGVSLSYYGEPLMCKNLAEMISYLHKNRISVSFPSNFSVHLTDKKIRELITSGLDSIMVSADGVTEETYKQYRQNGRFDLIFNNVKRISEIKKQMKVNHPRLIWKFIIFEHNKHEADLVEKKYRELGFDSYEINYDQSAEEFIKQKREYARQMDIKKKPCFWLWHTMVIRYDGSVLPCCKPDFNMGNVKEKRIVDIWNSTKYENMRESFNKRQYGLDMDEKCIGCSVR